MGNEKSASGYLRINKTHLLDHNSGKPMCPPIMPAWDNFDIRARLARAFKAPVSVRQ